MEQNVIYVGIDVDDVRYHGSALDKRTGEMLDFQCRPTLKGLVQQLEKVHQYFDDGDLKLCYEASYVGFSLQRDLNDRGYHCVRAVSTFDGLIFTIGDGPSAIVTAAPTPRSIPRLSERRIVER